MAASNPVRIGFTPGQDVTLDHLQDQIEWYDRKSGSNQKAFKILKICTISAAALIPRLLEFDAVRIVDTQRAYMQTALALLKDAVLQLID